MTQIDILWKLTEVYVIAWCAVYTHAANNQDKPFWQNFLNPFGF